MMLTLPDRAERCRIINLIHRTKDKEHCRRLNAILPLADGHCVAAVSRLTAAARSSINRWVNWYTLYGLEGLESEPRGRKPVLPFVQIAGLLRLLVQLSTQALGYQRSRWSTELMALELKRSWQLSLHASTKRCWLPRLGIVWRRPAPTLHIRDPHKEAKMTVINEALARCSIDYPVFYEDEVDIQLNPKLGADWMLRANQKKVVTPGQNRKHYIAGALHAGTGNVTYVASDSKDTDLFLSLIKTLKRTYRCAKSITLILGNYIIHKSKKAQRWLASNSKFIVLFQPVYSPWVYRIERLWHALHETITRNHQCRKFGELLHRVRYFLDNAAPYPGNGYGLMQVSGIRISYLVELRPRV